VDQEGDVFLCGLTTANLADPTALDIYAAKVSPEGVVLWEEAPAAPMEQQAIFMTVDSTDTPIMVGQLAGTVSLDGSILMSKGFRDVFVDKLANPP
jgi:hypothetical protein